MIFGILIGAEEEITLLIFNKFYEILLELWPFAIFGHLLLSCALHKFRTMYANVLKFHIWIRHEKT